MQIGHTKKYCYKHSQNLMVEHTPTMCIQRSAPNRWFYPVYSMLWSSPVAVNIPCTLVWLVQKFYLSWNCFLGRVGRVFKELVLNTVIQFWSLQIYIT